MFSYHYYMGSLINCNDIVNIFTSKLNRKDKNNPNLIISLIVQYMCNISGYNIKKLKYQCTEVNECNASCIMYNVYYTLFRLVNDEYTIQTEFNINRFKRVNINKLNKNKYLLYNINQTKIISKWLSRNTNLYKYNPCQLLNDEANTYIVNHLINKLNNGNNKHNNFDGKLYLNPICINTKNELLKNILTRVNVDTLNKFTLNTPLDNLNMDKFDKIADECDKVYSQLLTSCANNLKVYIKYDKYALDIKTRYNSYFETNKILLSFPLISEKLDNREDIDTKYEKYLKYVYGNINKTIINYKEPF